jgi:hypothetical protein
MASPKDKADEGQALGNETLTSALLRELRENSVALATFGAEQRLLRDRVAQLTKILKADEGSESLITRFSILENDVKELKKESDKQESRLEKLNDTSQTFIIEDRKDMRESQKQKWQTIAAVITALVAATVTIITAIYAHK